MRKTIIRFAITLITLLIIPLSALAQEKVVSGVVRDTDQKPIPGANILVKGTLRGTSSDMNGEFRITVGQADKVLQVSFVGMHPVEVEIGNSSFLEIIMSEGIEVEEVIVTAMGIRRSEKSLGYAVTQVTGEDISGSNESNLINALSGKVAGLDISSSGGGVGSSSRIIIRGVSSISSDNQPLFVVDGIPVINNLRSRGTVDYGNALSDINPADIESLTVLKGASAAALYGSQAANGAVIITTRSGRSGAGFEFNSGVSFDRPFRLPDYQNKYGPGNDPSGWNYWESGQESYYAYGPELDKGLTGVDWTSRLDENGDPIPVELKSYKDNVRDFFQTGITFNNNLSFSKGETDKYSYRLAYSNMTQQGMLYNTDLSRNNISINASANINPKLVVTSSMLYSNTFSGNRMAGDNYPENPVKSAFFMPRSTNSDDLRNWRELLADGVPLPYEYNGNNPGIVAPGYCSATSDYYPNPFILLERLNNEFSSNRYFTVIGARYNFNESLSLEAKYSSEYIDEQIAVKADEGVRHWTGSVYSYKGYYSRNLTKRKNSTMNAMIFYRKDLGFINLNAFLGAERRDAMMDWESMSAPELVIPGVFNMSNSKGTREAANGYSQSRLNSIFGNLDISFQKGIYLTLTGRNDWTSTLPAANRSYFYPSASLSWVVSEAFSMPASVSFMKLRLNASQVGAGTSPYQLQKSYFNLNRLDNIYEASVENSLKNPNLKPTRTQQYEAGLDLRLFQSRLNLDLAAYSGRSFDQISWIVTPPSAGYTYRAVNVGEITNKGLELMFTAVPLKKQNLEWNMAFTWSRNINEVKSLAEGVDALPIGYAYSGIRTEARPGSAYGNMIGFRFRRDPDGNIIHVNGLPAIENQESVVGNITPDWLGNLSTGLRYKNLNLFVQFNGKFGGDMFSLTTQWLRQYGLATETENLYRQGSIVGKGVMEVAQGDEVIYVPNNVSVSFQDYNYRLNQYGLHEPVIFDASYIKFKEARITYDLPRKILGNLPLRSVSISMVGRNLALLFANVPHVDPESAVSASPYYQGFELFNMPTARTVSFDITIKF